MTSAISIRPTAATFLCGFVLFYTDLVCSAATVQLSWHLNLNQGTTSISTGDTIEWTWTDSAPHSVRSIGSPSFTSSPTKTGSGSQYSVVFSTPGDYSYNCGVHGNNMKGLISVDADSTVEPTSTPPTTYPTDTPTAVPTTTTPSVSPSKEPTTGPSQEPTTATPSFSPTVAPSAEPSTISPLSPPTEEPTPTPTVQPTGARHIVDWGISDGTVAKVFVAIDDVVIWRWSDDFAHSVQSTDGGFTSSSVITGAGTEYSITFSSEGSYPFECAVHPGQMKGKVVVSTTGEETGSGNRIGWALNNHVILGALLGIIMLFFV